MLHLQQRFSTVRSVHRSVTVKHRRSCGQDVHCTSLCFTVSPQTQSSLKNMRQTSLVLFSKIMTEDQNQVNIKDNWKVVDYQMKNINFIKELKKKKAAMLNSGCITFGHHWNDKSVFASLWKLKHDLFNTNT